MMRLLYLSAAWTGFLGRKGSDEPEFNFRGDLDDVRIYNRALSGEEILQLYGEG